MLAIHQPRLGNALPTDDQRHPGRLLIEHRLVFQPMGRVHIAVVTREYNHGVLIQPRFTQCRQNHADLRIHLLREPGIGPTMQPPLFIRPLLPRMGAEGSLIRGQDGLWFAFRNFKIGRQWRTDPGEEFLPRQAGRQGQRLNERLRPGRLARSMFIADRHETDVMRVDERRHHQEGPVMWLTQEFRAGLGQFPPLIAGDVFEADLFELHGQVDLAAIDRLVAGLSEHAAQRVLEKIRRHLVPPLGAIGFHADPAGQNPGHHAEP